MRAFAETLIAAEVDAELEVARNKLLFASVVIRNHFRHSVSPNVGCALFEEGSLFRHSCAPNASWIVLDDTLFVRARRAIAVDEQLTLAYREMIAGSSAIERRQLLRRHCFFSCTCALCDANESTPGPRLPSFSLSLVRKIARHEDGALEAASAMYQGLQDALSSVSCALDEIDAPGAWMQLALVAMILSMDAQARDLVTAEKQHLSATALFDAAYRIHARLNGGGALFFKQRVRFELAPQLTELLALSH